MSRKEQEWYAKRVAQVFLEFNKDKAKTGNYFASAVPQEKRKSERKVVNRIINRAIERDMKIDFKKPTGPPPTKSTPEVLKSIENTFQENPSSSVRDVALKLNISPTTVSRVKTKKLKIVAFRKSASPKYRKDQAFRSKKNSRKIYENFLSKDMVIIMNDESYCPVDPTLIPWRDFFHCRKNEKNLVPIKDKIKEEKFPKQFLVWQAIDEEGNKSEAFISNQTMNSKVYLEECIKKKLVPFIERHHPHKRVFFWFDMATCDYANDVKNFLI